MEFSNVSDDAFAAFAENEERKAEGRQGSQFQSNQHWTGMETSIPKIVRVIGGPPNSNLNPYTSIVVSKSRIVGDDGKQFEVWKPSMTADPNYILNKIIAKVTKPQWTSNGEKTFPVKDKYPEIYNIVEKNGLSSGDKRYIFDRGWTGTEVVIMNVIDRSQMQWHRENKHTMLLAKGVNIGKDGSEFPDKGVSSFAIMSRITHLFKAYGSWEKYDIAFTKTGRKDNPYVIINATATPMEVEAQYRSLISKEDHLTDEEKSWEAYNLQEEFKYTSATKIYNKLSLTIKKIDNALGTDFLAELEDLVNQEKKAGIVDSAPSYSAVSSDDETEEIPTPTRRVTESVSAEESYPPYLDDQPGLKDLYVRTRSFKDGRYDIEWKPEAGDCPECSQCHTPSPLTATHCPGCGAAFELAK